MVTVLEECITEEQRSVVRFLLAKGLSAKDIHTEMFPVYGGKCLSRKAVPNRVENVSLMTKKLELRCGNG
jgi:ribulose 1,5-bisphosphate synthetase/thiazole synthase